MAEAATDRTAILAAIGTALAGVTTPALLVTEGMPWSIVADRSCFWWYAGDETNAEMGGISLSERAVTEKFKIGVYWLPPSSQQLQTAMVAEAWNANRSIQQALEASTSLGGLAAVAGLDIQPAVAGLWQHFSGATYYALEIELQLWVASGDTQGA